MRASNHLLSTLSIQTECIANLLCKSQYVIMHLIWNTKCSVLKTRPHWIKILRFLTFIRKGYDTGFFSIQLEALSKVANMPQIEGLFMDPYYKLHYPEGATHMDHFPDELREVVHNHWGTFPPQHPLVVDLFGILFFVLTFASFFGNGLVIYVFLATKSLRTPVSIILWAFETFIYYLYLSL